MLPALPEYLRLARLTAGGLASRLGFTYEEVEDLRIGIDELCFCLVGSEGREGTLTLHYAVTPEGLVIEGSTDRDSDRAAAAGSGGSKLSELSGHILASVVDEYSVSAEGVGQTFRLLKRRSAPAPERRPGPTAPGTPRGPA